MRASKQKKGAESQVVIIKVWEAFMVRIRERGGWRLPVSLLPEPSFVSTRKKKKTGERRKRSTVKKKKPRMRKE
jgi:hypothetical protein